MQIGVIGVNHKVAPISLREVIAKACQVLFHEDHPRHFACDTILISTCNRIEIYFSAIQISEAHSYIIRCLQELIPVEFEHALYTYFEAHCFEHLTRVIAGLDSAIVGETEIQGQVKTSYIKTQAKQNLSAPLHFVFQKALRIAKKIRQEFPSTRQFPSVEQLIYEKCMAMNPSHTKILFLGASSINAKIYHYLAMKGYYAFTIASRHVDSAKKLFRYPNTTINGWSLLDQWSSYELIVCGAKHWEYVLNKTHFLNSSSLNTRLIFDLGVPRNVDPVFFKHSHLQLIHIDQLAQDNLFLPHENREKQIETLYEKIQKKVIEYTTAFYKKEKKKALYTHYLAS